MNKDHEPKQGDIYQYQDGWFFLVIKESYGKLNYIWIAENRNEKEIENSAFLLMQPQHSEVLHWPEILNQSKFVAHLSAKTLIEELEKIK